MNAERAFFMRECNKRGIRIYPVPAYGYYRLHIEYNRTENFDPKYIKKIKEGQEKYKITETEWCEKIYELYEMIYNKHIKPKLSKSAA